MKRNPLRTLEGDHTGLDAPHGLAVDEKDRLLFVNTCGHHSDVSVARTAKWFPPAIKFMRWTQVAIPSPCG